VTGVLPLQVGDQVQLVDALPGKPPVPAGTVGEVLVIGLPWNAVSVQFPPVQRGRPGPLRQVRQVHLRRLERTAGDAA